jgi:cation transport regulator
MPYENNNDLPSSVTDNVPEHGQTIYRKAYNNAWDEYEKSSDRYGDASREEVAHKVAWSAVKNVYEKDGDDWVKK